MTPRPCIAPIGPEPSERQTTKNPPGIFSQSSSPDIGPPAPQGPAFIVPVECHLPTK